MARSRTTVAPRGVVITPWQEVASVARATEIIRRVHVRAARATAEAAIEIGRRIEAVKPRLEHGEFEAWLREALPFEPRTAQRYVALAAWAADNPDDAERFVPLGTTKLYRVAALPPRRRRRLRLGVPIAIPGGGRKPIDVMTVAELDRVIGNLAPAPVEPPAADKALAGFKRRLAGLQSWSEQLLAHQGELDPGDVSEIVAELQSLAETLDDAFG